MDTKNKELLLKDLNARLPYGVKIELLWWDMCKWTYIDTTLEADHIEQLINDEDDDIEIEPYLRPMSSMTEEQSKVYHELIDGMFGTSALINFEILIDFFNANHLDYRGLIRKGLAIDATNLNIYYLGRVNK